MIVYTVFAGLQWAQARWTNRLTREALDGNNQTLRQTLAKMQGQIDATHILAGHAKAQAEKTAVIANNSQRQARSSGALSVQAQRSADYAQKAVKASIEADRPWVGVSYYEIPPLVEGQRVTISLRYMNTGRRPATATIRSTTLESTNLPINPISLVNQPASLAFILPGATFIQKLPYTVPDPGWLPRLKREHKVFFIVAEITYTDVGTNTSHITHFCAFYDPTSKETPFPLCTRYNNAEQKEYEHYPVTESHFVPR